MNQIFAIVQKKSTAGIVYTKNTHDTQLFFLRLSRFDILKYHNYAFEYKYT